jgi:hypothetical protein
MCIRVSVCIPFPERVVLSLADAFHCKGIRHPLLREPSPQIHLISQTEVDDPNLLAGPEGFALPDTGPMGLSSQNEFGNIYL